MSKLNCPFCNSRDTFNIAYSYVGYKKNKKDYIDAEKIGLHVSYKKGFNKIDFDGEKLISRFPNKYCKSCKKTFLTRKVLYTVDIGNIILIININDNYYKCIFDFRDKNNPTYTLKINWITVKDKVSLTIKDMNKVLFSFKKYRPNKWNGHYGNPYDYYNYYWILKCVYLNGTDYVRSGNDEVQYNWRNFIKPLKLIFDEDIFKSLTNM